MLDNGSNFYSVVAPCLLIESCCSRICPLSPKRGQLLRYLSQAPNMYLVLQHMSPVSQYIATATYCTTAVPCVPICSNYCTTVSVNCSIYQYVCVRVHTQHKNKNGTWTKRIGTKCIGDKTYRPKTSPTKRISYKMYWRQNVLADKTYQQQNVSAT